MNVDEFWDWSVAHYQAKALEQTLLDLQDRANLVVLEVFLALWLGQQRRVWSLADYQALRTRTEDWIEEVVLPLRLTRQRWKSQAELAAARARLLQLELAAERQLAELMWQDFDPRQIEQFPERSPSECARANITMLFAAREGEFAPLVDAVVDMALMST